MSLARLSDIELYKKFYQLELKKPGIRQCLYQSSLYYFHRFIGYSLELSTTPALASTTADATAIRIQLTHPLYTSCLAQLIQSHRSERV